jgi:ABC-2 type transport system permease protein
MSPLGPIVRAAAFFSKELREVVRRPGVLISVVFGPFLIMFLFGMGTTGFRDRIVTEIVVPADLALSRDPEYYASLVQGRIEVVNIGEDAEGAERRLREGEIDLLIVAPEDAAAKLRSGQQTEMRVAWNEIDPLADAFTYALTAILVGNVNAEIIEQAAADGIALAEEELNGDVTTIPAEVIARPSTAETENVAPTPASVVNFYGPAVLALVIQHLGVSLTALSLVRERLGGQIDRYRVAPVGAAEVLLGKYAAHGLLSLATGAAVMGLLVGVLGVPMIDGWLVPALVAGLLALASLGAGIVISLLADSERQAVQLSMLLLLASVFLSGLVLPVSDFAWWIEPIAYLLPVTHGIAALQESMLRGELQTVWAPVVLAAMGVVLYILAVVLMRRALRSAA